jgi:DNA-binding response OmpR family regulator
LIIEDHSTLIDSLQRGLSLLHHDVLTAQTGEEGLPMALSEPVDLVVLDLMLPGKSGFEVLRELRESGFEKPILILSARDALNDRQRGRELGANDFLIKPFAFAELMARIDSLLEQSEDASSSDEAPPCAD